MNQLIKQEIQKSNIPEAVAAIATAVESGEINALEAITTLKWYESVITQARKEIMEQALKERAKYGKGECAVLGFKITEMEAGTSYEYSGCGDVIWDDLNNQMTVLKEKMKDRESFLKAIKEPTDLIDRATGETFLVVPPVKRSTTVLKFS